MRREERLTAPVPISRHRFRHPTSTMAIHQLADQRQARPEGVLRYRSGRPCGHPATEADEFRPNWVEFGPPGRQGPLASKKIGARFASHQLAMTLSQASRPGGRPIPLLKGALGAAVALAALSLSTGAAHAACGAGSVANTLCRVTVGGLQYDVTLFTGKYNNNTSKFATAANGGVMPWWTGGTGGSSATALAFATAVGDYFGLQNSPGNVGPFFGYNVFTEISVIQVSNKAIGSVVGTNNFDVSDPLTYAQATLYTPPAASPAPGPLPLFGAGAAFGFSRQLRKRIQGSRLQVSSSQPRA